MLEGIPDSIEAAPDKVIATNVDYFRAGDDHDHLYLGPRRPPDPITSSQAEFIVAQAPRALGKPYYLLGDGAAFLGAFFNIEEVKNRVIDPFSTDRGYSCMGLVDVLYLMAGKSLVGNFDRLVLAATPKDLMESTLAVNEVRIPRGLAYSMDFYGVIRKPEYGATTARVPYMRDRRKSDDGVECSYDIEFPNLPSGATVSDDSLGYHFNWTPAQVGTFKMDVVMRADVKEKRAKFNIFRGKFKQERERKDPIRQTFTFRVTN